MSTILHCQRRQRLTLVLTFALILQNHGNQDFLDVGMLIVVFSCVLPSIFYHCLKFPDEEANCIWKFLVYFHNQGLKKCWCGQKPSAVAKPGQKWKWRSTLKMFDRPNWLLHCSMCVRSSSLIIPAGPLVDPPLGGTWAQSWWETGTMPGLSQFNVSTRRSLIEHYCVQLYPAPLPLFVQDCRWGSHMASPIHADSGKRQNNRWLRHQLGVHQHHCQNYPPTPVAWK